MTEPAGAVIIPARVVCRSEEGCRQLAEMVRATEPITIILVMLALTILSLAFHVYLGPA